MAAYDEGLLHRSSSTFMAVAGALPGIGGLSSKPPAPHPLILDPFLPTTRHRRSRARVIIFETESS